MDAESLVSEHFAESMATKKAAAKVLAPAIARAGLLMARSLLDDGKIFSCGNGGSAADAQHFSAEMLNRFELERYRHLEIRRMSIAQLLRPMTAR